MAGTRHYWVLTHRWAGLTTAIFLLIAGLTGTVIAFEEELEAWLNPDLFIVTTPLDARGHPQPMLDPFELRERVEQSLPEYFVTNVRFYREAGRSVIVPLRARPGTQATHTQALVDPYTGNVLDTRQYGATPFERETLIGFIYHLHYALALPGRWGQWLFGVIAIVWTLDCFIGLILTLPRGRPFFQKWQVAWKIKRGAAPVRFNLDLHRAFGLWLWALLLMYAWSSVMLNLREEVYRPVMSTAFSFAELPPARKLSPPLDHPPLDWHAANRAGQSAMQQLAVEKGFTVNFPFGLSYNRTTGYYQYSANTSRDISSDRGQTTVFIDGTQGARVAWRIPTGENSGDTISRWLQSLHMALVFGRPYQIFVAAIGLVVAMLSVTGIYLWWKKRRPRAARLKARTPVNGEAALPAPLELERQA
jgi:uncharacterized iron-regulated membrane protein